MPLEADIILFNDMLIAPFAFENGSENQDKGKKTNTKHEQHSRTH
jgi:hypothetical protein